MAIGNKKKMIDINTVYVLEHCKQYCDRNGITMSGLGEKIGHSGCYIQSSCRNGKLPPAELNLLSMITNMDIEKASRIEDEEAEDTPAEKTVSEKLDYIIELLEELTLICKLKGN